MDRVGGASCELTYFGSNVQIFAEICFDLPSAGYSLPGRSLEQPMYNLVSPESQPLLINLFSDPNLFLKYWWLGPSLPFTE